MENNEGKGRGGEEGYKESSSEKTCDLLWVGVTMGASSFRGEQGPPGGFEKNRNE